MSDPMAAMMPPMGDPYQDNVNFVSCMIGAFFYGVHAVLFLMSMKEIVMSRGRKILTPDSHLALGFFIIALFAAGTTFMSAFTQFIMDMFIDVVAHPNAREAEYLIAGDVTSFKVANVAFVVINALSAGFLIHRTWELYDRRIIIVLPLLAVFIASTAISFVAALRVALPDSAFDAVTANYATIYVSLSSALNLVIFILLLAHLLPQHEKGLGWPSLTFETSALLAISSVIFVATYASNDAVFNVFFALHAQVMCLAALIVALRLVYRCSVPTPASNRTVTSISADFPKGTQNSGVASRPDEMVVMSEKWNGKAGDTKRPRTGESAHSDRSEEAEIVSLDAREDNV
ncbi:hypothetical protein AURDEDRAFT_168486 [Auricularia subglabra TFB-10046 SS5]|nr:hypothetical protein AURDEDRAFT_168486 [Auricularia subglabra TFB-10046 SS5]